MKKILHFCMAHTKGRATIRLFLVLNMVVWGCLAAAFGAVLGCMMQVSANFFFCKKLLPWLGMEPPEWGLSAG